METVRENFEDVSQQAHEVPAVEDVHDLYAAGEVLKSIVEQVQTEIAESTEFMLDGPHDAVHYSVELVFGHIVQLLEVVFDDRLQK